MTDSENTALQRNKREQNELAQEDETTSLLTTEERLRSFQCPVEQRQMAATTEAPAHEA